jgi:hypothetical protein
MAYLPSVHEAGPFRTKGHTGVGHRVLSFHVGSCLVALGAEKGQGLTTASCGFFPKEERRDSHQVLTR